MEVQLIATEKGNYYVICLGKALIFIADLWTTFALKCYYYSHGHCWKGNADFEVMITTW